MCLWETDSELEETGVVPELSPDPDSLADEDDELGWDTAVHGRMRAAATGDDDVITVPYPGGPGGRRRIAPILDLPGELAEWGLTVETVPGWENRGSPVRLNAGSIAFGLFVAAITTTLPLALSPSIKVKS